MKKQQLVSLGLVVLLLSNSGFAVVASENITNTYIESNNPADETSDLLTNKNDNFSQKIAETGSELNNKTNIKQISEENNVGDDTNNNETEPSEKSNEDELGVDSSTAESEIVSEENKNVDVTITEGASQETVDLNGNNGEEKFDEKNVQRQSTNIWGTAPYEFDKETGVLTVNTGTIDNTSQPWRKAILASEIKRITFIGKVEVESDARSLFANLSQLISIDGLTYLNTSKVTDAMGMFASCTSLQSLDLSNFNTSNVTTMSAMFEKCHSLKELDLSSFDTGNVTNMEAMFGDSGKLEKLDLSNFDTSNVTTMEGMFVFCDSLKELDLSSFDTSKVLKMGIMFTRTSLSKISLGDKFQFQSNADLPEPTERNGVPNTGKWIREDRRSQAHTPKSFMANYGSGDLTAGTYIGEIPKDVNLWGTAPYEFDDTTGVLTVGEGIIDNKTQPWKQDVEAFDVKKIVFTGSVEADLNLDYLFTGCEFVETIDLGNLDTSNVTTMVGMFSNLYALKSLDLRPLDTSNVTNMNNMFGACFSLESLDLSSFDTSNVTNMEGMFFLCRSLNSVDVRSFDTSNVTSMHEMFRSCSALENLDLSSFDTRSVMDMSGMFLSYDGIPSLSKLTLGDNFSFLIDAGLEAPNRMDEGVENTGKWIKEDGTSKAYTPQDFMLNYGTGDLTAGTYIGEVPNNLNLWGTAPYEFDDATGVLTVGEGIIDNKTQPWKQDVEASKIKKMVFSQHVKLIGDGSWLFSEDLALDQLSNLEEIEGLSNLDTSEITSMQSMFYGCSSLLELDLSGFDTSKVTNMEGMFALCSSLKELDLSSFHTELVKNMTYMVNSCKSLNQLDLSSFDTSGITSMRDMFARTPISKLLLGGKFRFQMDAGLQQPAEQNNSHNTGKWIKEDKQSKAHTPESFMKNYGTEDLTAGSYIGEISEVKLTGKINFSRPEGVIGKELSATITIAHEGSNYKAENITVEINKFLDSDYIDQQTFKFDDELVIETRSTKDNSLISKTTKPFTDETVELEGLEVNNYYNVIISGIVWNNSKKTDDGNYHINIGYDYPGNSEKDNIAVQGFYFIQSGLFGLTNVPEKLVFKDTLFSPVMKELIVKRLEPSWGMEVTDYRGTIGIEENIPADRSNWEIVATAKPFINEKGQSISQDVVGIIYTQNNQTTELSSDAETLIESHNVSGEIPQINHTTRLSWQGEEGFLAKVYNSKGIEPGDTLQAELTIELRSAP